MSIEQRILFLSEAPGCHHSRELRAIAFQVRKLEESLPDDPRATAVVLVGKRI